MADNGNYTEERICKVCGRIFIPSSHDDECCPGVCTMTNIALGGEAGVQSPIGHKRRVRDGVMLRSSCANSDNAQYPRVHEMLSLPIAKRWTIAKTFTPEEYSYYKKLEKRMFADDMWYTEECGGYGGDDAGEGEDNGEGRVEPVGDSDDGTI